MKKRGVRDQMGKLKSVLARIIESYPLTDAVIATKFTTNFRAGHGDKEIMANFTGNGSKSLHTSVNASLRKLQTDYIDLVCCPRSPNSPVKLSFKRSVPY